jgi:hypothetical protein
VEEEKREGVKRRKEIVRPENGLFLALAWNKHAI